MILIQSSLTEKLDTIVGLACDATGDGPQTGGFDSSLSDAIFAMPIALQQNRSPEMTESNTTENATPDPPSENHVQTVPETGVLLGIDYGTKRVGVAVSDRDQKFSSPLHNHDRHGVHVDERFFRKVVEEYRPVGLVVGLPIHLSGDESEKSREARLFGQWLGTITGLPFTFQDERFTSFQAEQLLMAAELSKKKRKERMDKLAAQILLQTFLDARIAAKQSPAIP